MHPKVWTRWWLLGFKKHGFWCERNLSHGGRSLLKGVTSFELKKLVHQLSVLVLLLRPPARRVTSMLLLSGYFYLGSSKVVTFFPLSPKSMASLYKPLTYFSHNNVEKNQTQGIKPRNFKEQHLLTVHFSFAFSSLGSNFWEICWPSLTAGVKLSLQWVQI